MFYLRLFELMNINKTGFNEETTTLFAIAVISMTFLIDKEGLDLDKWFGRYGFIKCPV